MIVCCFYTSLRAVGFFSVRNWLFGRDLSPNVSHNATVSNHGSPTECNARDVFSVYTASYYTELLARLYTAQPAITTARKTIGIEPGLKRRGWNWMTKTVDGVARGGFTSNGTDVAGFSSRKASHIRYTLRPPPTPTCMNGRPDDSWPD